MSGLVDIWTSEIAKVKNKGQAVISSTCSGGSAQEAAAHADVEISGGGSMWWPTGLAQAALQAKKLPAFNCSEASISLIVDTFCA